MHATAPLESCDDEERSACHNLPPRREIPHYLPIVRPDTIRDASKQYIDLYSLQKERATMMGAGRSS
jgi:hypothetical protein